MPASFTQLQQKTDSLEIVSSPSVAPLVSLQKTFPAQLHLTQSHRAVTGPHPEPGVQRLCEGAGEGVQVNHRILGNAEKRERPLWAVEVNADPVAEGFRRAGLESLVVVARRVEPVGALQTPGPLVVTQQAARHVSVSGDVVVSNANVGAAAP